MNAEMFNPEDAVLAGFLDQTVSADQLMATAEAVAGQMKKLNMRAHHGTKIKARQAYLETMDKAIEIDSTSSL